MLNIIDIHRLMFTHFQECKRDVFCTEIECDRLTICQIVANAMVQVIETGEYH